MTMESMHIHILGLVVVEQELQGQTRQMRSRWEEMDLPVQLY